MAETKPVNILLRPDQKEFIDAMFRWGEVSAFFRAFIDDLMEMAEKDPVYARKIAISYLKKDIPFSLIIKGDEDA